MEEKGHEGGAPSENAAATTTAAASAANTKAPEIGLVEQAPRRRAGALKRKANSTTTSGISSTPKRLAREKPLVPLHHLHNGPCTRARQSPNKLAAAAYAATAAAADAILQNLAEQLPLPASSEIGEVISVTGEADMRIEDWQALEPVMDAEFEAIRSREANAHVVPTPAGWFSWTKIHPIEERSLASFFNGKSENRTPDIYMEIRNWIMKKFHADPKTQIELKDLQELSVGELDARQEVMEFLDHWGLINFHPFPQTDSAMDNADTNEDAKLTSLVEKLYRFETIQSSPPVGPRRDLSTPAVPLRLLPESNITEDLARPQEPSVEYHCNSCSADCSRKRYHCQKQADFDLCSECYSNGKFGSGMSSADFILMESADVPGVSGGSWMDQETLLLLEALELFGDNWNEIAEHVATKTKAQCILHFLQMPIEDNFFAGEDDLDDSLQKNTDPSSTNINSSTAKDVPEITESKTGASESDPGAHVSETGANEGQMLSSSTDISKADIVSEVKVTQEMGADSALNVLKDAFEATGSLPRPGEQFSFAEAGNPVMALAAFLAGLVEPDVATASARISLKAISVNSPGIQMATRHCFLLEDPPGDRGDAPDIESDAVDRVSEETQGDKEQKDEKNTEENNIIVPDASDRSNDCTDEKKEDAVSAENESLIPQNGECKEKSQVAKKPENGECTEGSHSAEERDGLATQEEVRPSTRTDLTNPTLPEVSTSTVTESSDLASAVEVAPSSLEVSGDEAAMASIAQSADVLKPVDIASDLVPLEDKEPRKSFASNPVVETGASTGEDPKNVVDCKNERNHSLKETEDNHNIDKLKRATVTALSAAAVKAKLLAKQEEDQIRQLATFLIEKQLHKLETKLAFFYEMESVIMRIREQLDRSRQRLYHERAQIIAARLGLPASASRALPPSLPTNKIAMSYANSVLKPPSSMIAQKPQFMRTTVAPASLPSNSFVTSSAMAGSTVHPSGQDKLSSVGTK